METVIIRVWLPDRPGALGQVASRIGAVRGEIVGIDILERDGGRAVDELAVELPDGGLEALVVREVEQVDGVKVEEIRSVADALHDPRLDALEAAAQVIGAADVEDLVDATTGAARRIGGAEWAALVDVEASELMGGDGPAPAAAWLVAFLAGSRASLRVVEGEAGPDDVIWAPLPGAGIALVVGRSGPPYRARERRQVAALARIVDRRLLELRRASARRQHPSVSR